MMTNVLPVAVGPKKTTGTLAATRTRISSATESVSRVGDRGPDPHPDERNPRFPVFTAAEPWSRRLSMTKAARLTPTKRASAGSMAAQSALPNGASSPAVLSRSRALYGSRVFKLKDASPEAILEEKNAFTLFTTGAYPRTGVRYINCI